MRTLPCEYAIGECSDELHELPFGSLFVSTVLDVLDGMRRRLFRLIDLLCGMLRRPVSTRFKFINGVHGLLAGGIFWSRGHRMLKLRRRLSFFCLACCLPFESCYDTRG